MRNAPVVAVVVIALFVFAASVEAGPGPDVKCAASQLKAAGKACDCRHGAAAKAVTSGDAADFTKCAAKLGDAFAKAEAKGFCPAVGKATTIDARFSALVTAVSSALQAGTATGDAAKCAAAKLKAAGKKCACVHAAQSKATLKGVAPDFTACDAKLDAAYAKAELKAGGACPTIADAEAICDQVQAQFVEVEADVADRDTQTYGVDGPYSVGLRTVTLVDTTRPTQANGTYPGAPTRTLVTDIWYPIAPGSGTVPISNAPITPTGGPFPLIVRAHGFSAFRTDSTYLTRQLASWGYVVVSPDFPLSNLNAPGGPTLADVGGQAGDVSFLIDSFIAENANASSFLFGRIDTAAIGTIGHSLGGATVLLATYHSTLRDPRIDATIALSPLSCVFLDGFFDTVATPLMIQFGTEDLITEYTTNGPNTFAFVNAPKYLVSYTGGTHLGFNDRFLYAANENGDAEIGCSIFVQPGDPRPVDFDPNLPPDFLGGPVAFVDPTGAQCGPLCPLPPASFMFTSRQNSLTKSASIAFFESELRGVVSAHRVITDRIDSDNADTTLQYSE